MKNKQKNIIRLAIASSLLVVSATIESSTLMAQTMTSNSQVGYTGMAGEALIALRTSEDLTIGSRGQVVANLQGLLTELGYLQVPAGVPFGYFGSLTKEALAKFQSSIGVANTGYFGPITKTTLTDWIMRSDNPLKLINQPPATTTVSSAPSSTASPQNALGSTGYWYQGNWYNSLPQGTTTLADINGYWNNGVWQSSGSNTQSAPTGSRGYWYNGTWYSVDNSEQSGFYSSNQSNSTNINLPQNSGQGTTGYWYEGSWYNSIPLSTTTLSSIDKFWYNGTQYQVQGSNISPQP